MPLLGNFNCPNPITFSSSVNLEWVDPMWLLVLSDSASSSIIYYIPSFFARDQMSKAGVSRIYIAFGWAQLVGRMAISGNLSVSKMRYHARV